jgi:hypothetical protein
VEVHLAGEQPVPDELVEGIVAADVLAQHHEGSRRVEQARCMEPAGRPEDGLALAQPAGQGEQQLRVHHGAVRDRRAAHPELVERRLAADPAGGRGHEVARRDGGRVQRAGQPDHDLVVGVGAGRGIPELHARDVVTRADQSLRQQESDGELRLVTRGAHRDGHVDRVLARPRRANRHGFLAGQAIVADLGGARAPGRDADTRRLALQGG